MKVRVERRNNQAGDKQNIRLIYHYGSYKDENGKLKHNREIESLDLYLYTDPQDKTQKRHNKDVEQLIEVIKSKRITEAASGKHGFSTITNQKARFYPFFKEAIKGKFRDTSDSNAKLWEACLKHVQRYYPDENITFEQITPEWLDGLKRHLDTKAKTKTGNLIKKSTASNYFNKVREVVKSAFDKGIINRNPLALVSGISTPKSERTYLTIEEVRALVQTDCRYDVLKRAFLFSCLTGLRWGDVNRLTWENVSVLNEVYRITFHQEKTGKLQYLDLTPQAYSLMGDPEPQGRVFVGLRYGSYQNTELVRWSVSAGITKHVTFHAARHTFAVSLLCNGTDIYTVSKLMGHSEVKTTQIYADIIDSVRKEAMHRIPDIGL